MLGTSFKEHTTNEYLWQQVSILTGRQELLLSNIKRRKLSCFGHVYRHDALPKIHIHGTVDGSRRKGWPRKNHRGTTSKIGQAGHCLPSCASQTTEVDGRRPYVTESFVGVPQRASRKLVLNVQKPKTKVYSPKPVDIVQEQCITATDDERYDKSP